MGLMIGGTEYSDQQIKDFYASGGDDNQFAQQLGITDPWQRRDLILQARQIAGPGTMGGDAGLQRYFEQYRQYNPNGANANNYQAWVASQNPDTLNAMRAGTFTGAASSPTDWAPGGIYAPGTGHDYSFEQGRTGMGAHGTGDSFTPWTGAFGETGGVQTSKPMYVDANGALRYGSSPTGQQSSVASPPGLMASMQGEKVTPNRVGYAASDAVGSGGSGGSAPPGMVIGGTQYTGDQIKQWLAGKSQDEVKAQAKSFGMTPTQVQQALAFGGMNYTPQQIEAFMGAPATSAGAPKSYAEYEALIKPEMLDAQGRFLGPNFGVNYQAEGMTPQQFYDFMNEQVGDPNARDGADAGPRARGVADPRWQEGVVSTANGLLGNWGVPLAMISAPFVAGALGYGAATGATGATGTGAVTSPVVGGTAGITTSTLAPLGGAAGTAGTVAGATGATGALTGATGTAGTVAGATGATGALTGAATDAGRGLLTSATGWKEFISPITSAIGGYLNTQSGNQAASQQADAVVRAAQIAADAAKFKPVGIKTNFGQSQFGYDDKGNLVSAGYTLDPLLQEQLGQLAGVSGGLMNQFTSSTGDTALMRQAALNAMQLGNKYLTTSPEQQAAKYLSDQQGLLAPGRATEMANLQALMQAQGRGGLAIGGGVNGQGAASPQMQALLNARMQQDAQLAANATQGGMDYTKFGLGTVGAAGDMLKGAYSTQSASLDPYLTALGAAQKIEGLGQNALQMGMDLGGKVTNANAQAGLLTAGGMTSAANITAQQAQQAGSPWASLLQGAGDALSRYKWGT